MAYQIVLYLHVAGALGFFLFHGATASATFGLKREGPLVKPNCSYERVK